MPNKTVYISQSDARTWAEAERLSPVSISKLLAELLTVYVDLRRQEDAEKVKD